MSVGQRMYLRLIIQKKENRKRKTKKYFYSIHKDKYINQDGWFYRIKNDIRMKNTKRKNHKKKQKKSRFIYICFFFFIQYRLLIQRKGI